MKYYYYEIKPTINEALIGYEGEEIFHYWGKRYIVWEDVNGE